MTACMIVLILICLVLGNSPQINLKAFMIIGMILCGLVLFLQIFIFKENDKPDFKISVALVFLFISGIVGVLTINNITSNKFLISSFAANRSFIFEEYSYQRMFGRVSLGWGMRFGQYQQFSSMVHVEKEFDYKKRIPTYSEFKQIQEENNQTDIFKSNKDEDLEPGKDQKASRKFFEEKVEYDVPEVKNLLISTISDFDKRDKKEKKENSSPKDSEAYDNANFDNKIEANEEKDPNDPFYINYQSMYRFYKMNNIDHSLPISNNQKIPLILDNYNLRSHWAKLVEIFTPFFVFKRRLFIKYPTYYPSRLMICIVMQIIIQVEIVQTLVVWIIKLIDFDGQALSLFIDLSKIPVIDVFRAALISVIVTLIFFILIVTYSTIRTLQGFKLSVLDLRLNGPTPIIAKAGIWGHINFFQSYLGNITFSSGPFLIVFFIFFTALFSISFWGLVWNLRMSWLPIVIVFILDFILDLVMRNCTSNGRFFTSRRLIQFVDVVKIFLGFYSGLFTGFMRFVVSLLLINITMFRVDRTGVPEWVLKTMNLDIVNGTFISMVNMYHTHNNPIVLQFANLLMDHSVKHRLKALEKAKNEKIETTGSQIPKITSKAENENLIENLNFETGQVKIEEEDFVDGKMTKSKRKRFLRMAYRWQLFALLVRNPTLMAERKCKVEEEKEKEEGEALEEVPEDLNASKNQHSINMSSKSEQR